MSDPGSLSGPDNQKQKSAGDDELPVAPKMDLSPTL